MATLVSNPPVLYTALRNVEYVFTMPSIGSGDIMKLFRYRIKNVTDNVYLTKWKYYKPIVDGQTITIDFYRDLFGVNQFEAPPLGLPNVIVSDTSIIKTVEVEYGEREIDKSTGCTITDTVDGVSPRSDLINGLWRPWELQFPLTGFILSNRPELYETNVNSADWLYVAGTYYFQKVYYNSSGTIIGGAFLTATQTFPNSVVSIVPIGFQAAPAGTSMIRVYAKQSGAPTVPTDHYCTIKATEPKDNEETIITDIYFSNHKGGIDLMSFDKIESKDMSVAKDYITSRYDKNITLPIQRGQIKVNTNAAFPTINLIKQFERLTYKQTEWLDTFISSSNIWIRQTYESGAEILVRGNLADGTYQTYGDEVELTAAINYSEELINPI